MTASPYVGFIQGILEDEARLEDDGYLEQSGYYRMADRCIAAAGHFMGARNGQELRQWMRDFFAQFRQIQNGEDNSLELSTREGHSRKDARITLQKLSKSEAFEVVDGHHRIAIHHVLGREEVSAVVQERKTRW
jgi:hypothetical protein